MRAPGQTGGVVTAKLDRWVAEGRPVKAQAPGGMLDAGDPVVRNRLLAARSFGTHLPLAADNIFEGR